MNIKILLSISAIILGLFFGSSALAIIEKSNPPITWGDIPFIFIGSIVGVMFVIGFQIFRKESKYSKNSISFFFLSSLWTISVGVSSLIATETMSPESIVYLILGIGMLAGVIITSRIFKWRYSETI